MESLGLQRLPELWNVLCGDMVMIGPRPLEPMAAETLENQIPLYRWRLGSAPGLIGWAQLNLGTKEVDPIEELAYDLYYLKRGDVTLNCYILGQALITLGRDKLLGAA